MSSELLQNAPLEAQYQLEISLRKAFELLQPQLKPPFPLTIPSEEEYRQLNRAILYALLTEPHFTKVHFTHLHAIVTDGYELFVNLLQQIALEFYPKLHRPVKIQLIRATREMIRVSADKYDGLLICLLRWIVGGDFSDGNLWLCEELLRICFDNWDWLLENSLLLTSVLFTYLRLVADHCRLRGVPKFEALKRMEIDFCVRVLRNHFNLCMLIGRDLVRLLQDLVHIPEFQAVWKDILTNPTEFRAPGFWNISQLYGSMTPSHYHLLRITPEMETQLRFLLTHVKWGFQRRYQAWFARKFLCTPESEIVVSDIIRFICCAHHPTDTIIQSNVIQRWLFIGWLMKSCRSNHLEASAKLALFYDRLFFDERVDNVMNIEPGMLLMVNSLPKYIDLTQALLEFLFQLVDNFDVQRKDIIEHSVSTTFGILVKKKVVHSLEILSSCTLLSSFLRERLANIFHKPLDGDFREPSIVHLPQSSMPPLGLSTPSNLEQPKPSLTQQTSECSKEIGCDNTYASVNPAVPCSPQVLTDKSPVDIITDSIRGLGQAIKQSNALGSPVDIITDSIRGLGQAIKQSNALGLQVLEEILLFYAIHGSHSVDGAVAVDSALHPEVLACNIAEAFKLNGYNMFVPLTSPQKFDTDDETHSATSLILCTFIFCQHEQMQEMILFWSKNSYFIGPRLLSYASRLAYEAQKMSCLITSIDENTSTDISYSEMHLLKDHIQRYVSFKTAQAKRSPDVYSTPAVDGKLLVELVEGAFASYRSFLRLCSISHKEKDASPARLLLADIMCCCGWKMKSLKSLFYNIFSYLTDLTTGKEECIRLLVHRLDHVDIVSLQFELCLGRFSIFGEDTQTVSHLIKSSLNWGFVEQQKFWGLMASELANSRVKVEEIVAEFFCSDMLNPNVHSLAVGGLLSVCSHCAPSPEFVSMLLALPDNAFRDFAASVLANWSLSNDSMLFDSLKRSLENFGKDKVYIHSNSTVRINCSSISRFLNFLEQTRARTNCMSKLHASIPEIKAKLADSAVVQKSK